MKLMVCSRGKAMSTTNPSPWAVISIRNPGVEEAEFACPNLKAVLHLAFDDIDSIQSRFVAFDIAAAERIWDFVAGLDGIEILLVHCDLGASRSPGVAAALDKVMNGDDFFWFKTKTPNMRVYRCLIHVASQRGLI